MKINLAKNGNPIWIEVDKKVQQLVDTEIITCFTLDCLGRMKCNECICADDFGCYCNDYSIEELDEQGRVK